MSTAHYPVNNYEVYHAHVYFEQATLMFATALCLKAAELFGVAIGHVHQKTVGPHPKWSCQILFSSHDFEKLIPWLEQERNQLTVFVHGVTGDNLKDHTDYAYWLGDKVELNLSIFKQ